MTSIIHPSDCQPCSEGDGPCRLHATDYRYWQAAYMDLAHYVRTLDSVVAELHAVIANDDTQDVEGDASTARDAMRVADAIAALHAEHPEAIA